MMTENEKLSLEATTNELTSSKIKTYTKMLMFPVTLMPFAVGISDSLEHKVLPDARSEIYTAAVLATMYIQPSTNEYIIEKMQLGIMFTAASYWIGRGLGGVMKNMYVLQ